MIDFSKTDSFSIFSGNIFYTIYKCPLSVCTWEMYLWWSTTLWNWAQRQWVKLFCKTSVAFLQESNLFVTTVTSSNIVCARWISIISINHHQASKGQIETQIWSVCLSVRSCSRFACKDPSIIKWVCKLWKNVNLVYLFLHIFKNSSAANEYLNILK